MSDTQMMTLYNKFGIRFHRRQAKNERIDWNLREYHRLYSELEKIKETMMQQTFDFDDEIRDVIVWIDCVGNKGNVRRIEGQFISCGGYWLIIKSYGKRHYIPVSKITQMDILHPEEIESESDSELTPEEVHEKAHE